MSIRLARAGVFGTEAVSQATVVLARATVSALAAQPVVPAAPAVRLAGAWLTGVTQPTVTPLVRFAGASLRGNIAIILPPVREVWNGTLWHPVVTEVYRGMS